MIDDHTNEAIPGNLKVSREGAFFVLRTRTATIHIPVSRAGEIINAIKEVTAG